MEEGHQDLSCVNASCVEHDDFDVPVAASTHIYQHYFPEDYGSFSGTALSKLADDARVRWLNIYRADDFVGTIIAGPSDTFPRNVPMKEGGHFCYWEREVLGAPEICVHLPGANKC